MGTYSVLENPHAWLPGALECAELGHDDKADWVDRWQNPTHPWPPRWGKGQEQITPRSNSF
jgi:hypothetical protein